MGEQNALIADIERYCRDHEIAESTFGRLAVNDGKFVGRLRAGRGVTTRTIERVRDFLENGRPAPARRNKATKGNGAAPAGSTASPARTETPADTAPDGSGQRAFRFYDNRQKYLMFVNTCSEKWVVADRVGMELSQIHPRPPALRVFDAGIGDGTVISRVMRDMHRRFPHVPFFVVGKEISLEDVRLSLEKMADRFFEHAPTVMVITNLYYSEAPWLMPRNVSAAAALNWHEVPLHRRSADPAPGQQSGQLRPGGRIAALPGLDERRIQGPEGAGAAGPFAGARRPHDRHPFARLRSGP